MKPDRRAAAPLQPLALTQLPSSFRLLSPAQRADLDCAVADALQDQHAACVGRLRALVKRAARREERSDLLAYLELLATADMVDLVRSSQGGEA